MCSSASSRAELLGPGRRLGPGHGQPPPRRTGEDRPRQRGRTPGPPRCPGADLQVLRPDDLVPVLAECRPQRLRHADESRVPRPRCGTPWGAPSPADPQPQLSAASTGHAVPGGTARMCPRARPGSDEVRRLSTVEECYEVSLDPADVAAIYALRPLPMSWSRLSIVTVLRRNWPRTSTASGSPQRLGDSGGAKPERAWLDNDRSFVRGGFGVLERGANVTSKKLRHRLLGLDGGG